MSRTFREWNPDQSWLFQPAPQHWLPDGHLVYFLLDVLEQLYLSPIMEKYDSEKGGNPRGNPLFSAHQRSRCESLGTTCLRRFPAGVLSPHSPRRTQERHSEKFCLSILISSTTFRRHYQSCSSIRAAHIHQPSPPKIEVTDECLIEVGFRKRWL
jgi:hypothetical protein